MRGGEGAVDVLAHLRLHALIPHALLRVPVELARQLAREVLEVLAARDAARRVERLEARAHLAHAVQQHDLLEAAGDGVEARVEDAKVEREAADEDALAPLQRVLQVGQPAVDAVLICNFDHGKVVEACLKSGKHMLVEKPLAFTRSEGKALVEAARISKAVNLIGYMKFYDEGYVEGVEHIRKAGTPKSIQVHDLNFDSQNSNPASICLSSLPQVDKEDLSNESVFLNGGEVMTKYNQDNPEMN